MMLSMISGKNKNKFSYGKKQYDIFHYVKVGIIFKGSLDLISMIPGVEKKKVFNVVDRLQQKLGIEALNDYIIRDSELIGYRIERTLNDSIKEYERNT
jgi:hypothetical protein